MFIRHLKPSPMLAVAVGALVVGLAAPAAAQQAIHLINGKSIKNHTISGKKLKKNTLTGRQIKESTLGKVPKAKSASTAGDATTLDGLPATSFATAGLPMVAGVGNGVGSNLDCASGTLSIEVDDGRGTPVDGRFAFQLDGPTVTWGVIRGNGTIRTGTTNVTTGSVDHVAGSGIYCIHFNPDAGGDDPESAVASVHGLHSQ
jgi:hypothetical protein